MSYAKLTKNAAYASMATALVLIVTKIYAWWLTGSVSLLSSLADSALDLVVSVVNFLAIRYALEPPDEDHRFGHTSAEDLAALFQALFITASAVFVSYHAVDRLLYPAPLEQEAIGIAVMLFSMVVTLGLVVYQKHVVKQTGSVAVYADSFHYVSDLLMNGAVIAALLLVKYMGWLLADPVIGFAIALYIFSGAVKIGKSAFDRLMDKEFPEKERKKVEEIIRSSKGILGFHDLKTRSSGPKSFIQCHVEMEGSISLKQAHVISDALEDRLKKAFPKAEIIIHQDPHVPGKKL